MLVVECVPPSDLAQAVLEGTSYEVESVRRAAEAATRSTMQAEGEIYMPDAGRHQGYKGFYERGYLQLQAPLRQLAREFERLPDEDR